MKIGRKQTGRPGRVKQNEPGNHVLLSQVAVLGLLVTLSACAPSVGGWRSPVKNEASTRADYARCQAQAEQTTLQMRQANRPGFGTTDRPGTFNPRGDDTMAIADRADTTNIYDALVSSCMSRKGYRQPGDTVPRGD